VRKLLNAVVLGRDIDPTQFAIWMTAIVMTPDRHRQHVPCAAMRQAPVDVTSASCSPINILHGHTMVAVALLAA
jgi:hypothetical protein